MINENSERLKKSEAELVELQLVLEKAGAFFDEARASAHGNASYDSGSVSAVDAPLLDDVPVRPSSCTRTAGHPHSQRSWAHAANARCRTR